MDTCDRIIIWSIMVLMLICTRIIEVELHTTTKQICKAITEAHSKPECIKQGDF